MVYASNLSSSLVSPYSIRLDLTQHFTSMQAVAGWCSHKGPTAISSMFWQGSESDFFGTGATTTQQKRKKASQRKRNGKRKREKKWWRGAAARRLLLLRCGWPRSLVRTPSTVVTADNLLLISFLFFSFSFFLSLFWYFYLISPTAPFWLCRLCVCVGTVDVLAAFEIRSRVEKIFEIDTRTRAVYTPNAKKWRHGLAGVLDKWHDWRSSFPTDARQATHSPPL